MNRIAAMKPIPKSIPSTISMFNLLFGYKNTASEETVLMREN